jgi:outer membrane protein assembly factor BamB
VDKYEPAKKNQMGGGLPFKFQFYKVKNSLVSIITAFIVVLLLFSIFSALYSIPIAQAALQTTTDTRSSTLTPKLLWNYTHVRDIFHRPVVVNGVVYVNSQVDSCVAAINAETGVEIWYHHSGSSLSTSSSIAVANDIIYLNAPGMFWALNAMDGTELWRYPLGNNASPTVVDGVVYFGATTISDKESKMDELVVALDAITGTKLWHTPIGNDIYDSSGFSSPVVVDGVVYIGALDNNVYALNAKDGEILWRFTTGRPVVSSPVVVDGVVYIGSYDYNVYAIDASDGKKLWNYHTDGLVDSTPAVVNGEIYLSSSFGHNLYCLNAVNGEKLWSIYNKFSFGSPTVVDDVVYVASFPGLYAFSTIEFSSDTPDRKSVV